MSKTYSEAELRSAASEYFNGDTLAISVWIKKYALKINGEFVECSPVETIKRMAKEIHRMEQKFPNPLSYEEIFETLENFKYFIFAGSILFGLGNPNKVSLANCFFINNNADSYGGIFNLDESMAQLMKRRAGVGVTLEHLRPREASVKNSAQSSTGAVSFMERYSNTTREVAQDGRRGALMISMHVHHPDIEDFINSKKDLTKITGANISVKITDEFMNAANKDEDFILHWPIKEKQPVIKELLPYNKIHKLEDGTYVKRVKAKKIWDQIIKMAHTNAEPGILFWDQTLRESPADCYKEDGFETQGTNPCITGDTMVTVADGRGNIRIDQLAKEEKDVPVYCLNEKGNIEIQLMRNPRITGYNQPIYKVKLDSGDSVKVTGNHKLRLKSGEYKEAKNLKYGDSLHIMSRTTLALNDIWKKSNSRSADYIWIKNDEKKYNKNEHRSIYEFYNDPIEKGNVIHHKDFSSLNNNISNLEKMSKEDHNYLHSELIKGKNNPYHRMSDEWKHNFASHPGLSNPTAYQISNEELINHGLILGKQFNRRFSEQEWIKYATKNNLPKFIKSFRGFKGTYEFSLFIASKLNFEYINEDTRLTRRYQEALKNSYTAKIENSKVLIERICEECNKLFWTNYNTREYATCSYSCSNKFQNKTSTINIDRTSTINKTYKRKGEEKSQQQIKIYSDLKFKIKKEPLLKEWEKECKANNISPRLGTKHGIKTWNTVKELAKDYNHKVVSVELIGNDIVYNGTVDKYHNFFIGGFKSLNEVGKPKWLSINNLQCGEVPLSPFDSCRLGSLNLFNLVKNPFTTKSMFDWDLLATMTKRAQRFMDDIVSLEEEKINGIIAKIDNDPEDTKIKRNERDVWSTVLDVLRKGRRTGVGVLGLGDTLAAMGITFGTKEATKFAKNIQKVMAVNSYRESVKLAKERGAFPIWDADKEAGNPFIVRVISQNFDNKEYEDYLKYGRRNIATLSIAPTGSLAIIGQTTSGIEPVFKIYYRRRRKINPNEENVKVDFIDENGDSWEEYNIIHRPFIDWCYDIRKMINDITYEEFVNEIQSYSEATLDQIVAESPWNGSESHSIDYHEKVKMQGAIQKWIDHSISITHNLPENVSVDEVNKIYFEGWKSGCKGITIYRDGSRSGVLLSKKENNVDFPITIAPKRPKSIPADYYVGTANGIKFAVIIGVWPDGKSKGKPYELFAFENPPSLKNTKGHITKIKKGHYKFVNGEFEINSLELAAERVEEKSLSITSSMLLRHGVPIEQIIKTIKKIDENITSFSSVVRRYLARYIDSEVTEEDCPECSDKLIKTGGCIQCPTCGYEKCG